MSPLTQGLNYRSACDSSPHSSLWQLRTVIFAYLKCQFIRIMIMIVMIILLLVVVVSIITVRPMVMQPSDNSQCLVFTAVPPLRKCTVTVRNKVSKLGRLSCIRVNTVAALNKLINQ